MKKQIIEFLKNESGQDLSEYAVIIGLVSLGVLGVMASEGQSIVPIAHSANNLVQTAALVAGS